MVATNVSHLFISISHFNPSCYCDLSLLKTTTSNTEKVNNHWDFFLKSLQDSLSFHSRLDEGPVVISNAPQRTKDFEYVELRNSANDKIATHPK